MYQATATMTKWHQRPASDGRVGDTDSRRLCSRRVMSNAQNI